MFNQHKKQSPIISLLGMGGGGTGNAFGGAVPGTDIYDYGDTITGLSKSGAGTVSSAANINQYIDTYGSWNSITDGQTGNEFARYITWYKGSSFDFGGIAIASGHGNGDDPLGGKDVAIYTSTDTTNGDNGTWTIQTPKWIRKSYSPKHSSASTYLANRTSAVSSNHWILGANLLQDGIDSNGGDASLIYNKYGAAPQHDRIYFDTISVKGVRLDVRGKWYNGYYTNEKPHIASGYIFAPNNYTHLATELESDSKTTCYIDPGLTSDNVNFTDQSGNGYNFATNNGNNRGTVSYNSGNGGHIRISSGSLRNGANVARGGSDSFSFGCWVKINGGSSNGDGGVIWYGAQGTNQHVFVRNNINITGTMAVGADINSADAWTSQFTKDQRVDGHISSVGVSNWFFMALRYHKDGLIETSWDGRPFDLQFNTILGRASSLTLPFGVGCDPYNDNDSSHHFGPFFFYAGIIPYGRVLREWDRYKTRFGRTGDGDYTTAFAGNT
jgi:hypothetical protein